MKTHIRFSYRVVFIALAAFLAAGVATINISAPSSAQTAAQSNPLAGLRWRNIRPHRGGRSVAVAGVPSQPMVYYFGGTGGGVWKTSEAA
jgi:hypothetical protein